ncbi:hypothetical protein [Priestia megaterium]|uniref:Uncharacterized protein n=1 Tax=Priestia megaterium TaxID=1404 RepID=A0A6M6E2G5_PRIMG|nr:hypothetical protein [Priestia megaterium]QJX79946.1 hypothetical protein FDZ14_27990 [Priestia megaterium]
MNTMAKMPAQKLAEDVIKQNKTTTKVNAKKFIKLVTDVAKNTGMDNWLTNQTVKLVDETKSYQDFNIYGLVKVRYMKETSKFLGFVGELNNNYRSKFEGMVTKTAHISSVLSISGEFKGFRSTYNQFIEELTSCFALQWNELYLYKVQWIFDFYEFLCDEYEDVSISFTSQIVYLKKHDKMIKLTEVTHRGGGTIIGCQDVRLCEYIKYYNSESLEMVRLKLREIFNSKTPDCSQKNFELGSTKLDDLAYEIFPIHRHSEKWKNTLLKSLEKSVPAPLVEVVLTSIPVNLKVGSSEAKFEAEYYKCDLGFYAFEFDKKRVIFKETETEIKTYLLEQIVKEL